MSGKTRNCPVVVYCSSTSWGGLEMNSIRYSEWFAERGFPVMVACVPGSPLARAANSSGLRVLSITRNPKHLPIRHARAIAGQFASFRPEVVWFRDKRDMAVLAWAKRFSKVPFRLVYHQAMQLGVSKRDAVHSWRFRAIDRWIALLDYLADQVRLQTRFPQERIVTIPLGQDPGRFSGRTLTQSEARSAFNLPETAFVLGNIGRIDVLKGQHLLIEAAGILHQKGYPVHVLLVGEPTRNEGDSYLRQLESMRQDLRLEDHVHIHSFREDVLTAYRAMDVFVLASAGETFGNVTVEAMLSGTCTVGTNSSGTPELLDHGKAGRLFEPGDVHSLVNTLEELILHAELRQDLADAGYQRAMKYYSKEKVLDRLQAVLLNEV